MCMGSAPKTPSMAPPPTPAPAPIPTAPEASQGNIDAERKKRIEMLRGGLASTIKSGARGITGAGADLTSPALTGKQKLGV